MPQTNHTNEQCSNVTVHLSQLHRLPHLHLSQKKVTSSTLTSAKLYQVNSSGITSTNHRTPSVSLASYRYENNYKSYVTLPKFRKTFGCYVTHVFLQVAAYFALENYTKSLTFDPNDQSEVWKFFTYMFVHDSWHHLLLNVLIQCILAFNLERDQNSLIVAALYSCGGCMGALGAACVSSDLVIGASAGVYALLLSHIAHLIIVSVRQFQRAPIDATFLQNVDVVRYKLVKCFSVSVIVASDVAFNIFHYRSKMNPPISWGSHAIGGVAGFLLGLILYKNLDSSSKGKRKYSFWAGFWMFFSVLLSLISIDVQIKRCTPVNLRRSRYIYFC